MRIVSLNALRAGIERLRHKGGAKPDALYDLENGYVTVDGSTRSRPGTEEIADLPAGTKGLVAFDGGLTVFSHTAQTMPASTPQLSCELVIHPTDPTQALADIHFAAPFLGSLYVAAEFANGDTYHFWLRGSDTWAAGTTYQLGALVQPSTPNGYLYRARRLRAPGPTWAPGVVRAVGDRVEPTTFNGFEYECIDTIGTNPRSGTVEPTWPTTEGATVVEDTALGGTGVRQPIGSTEPPPADPGQDTRDRYGGLTHVQTSAL